MVPVQVPTSRRLITSLSWPAGVAWTSWSYIWRTTPLHRRQLEGTLAEDLPPPLPAGVPNDEIQSPEDGSGPLLHRIYSARIRGSRINARELMRRLSADPDTVAPRALAKFTKAAGPKSSMQVGDEFLVHMPGPWDGPVRTIETTPTSFRFATLEGHLEAGQIEWRAVDSDGLLVFEIESWARSGDWLSALMHDRLLMAKEVQLHMWTSVIERVEAEVGGQLERGIDIETRRVGAEHFNG